MKKLLGILLVLISGGARADFLDCTPIEWGGSGQEYTVGTTTSGTWYVWNCKLASGMIKPNGVVVVKGHKPSTGCLILTSTTNIFVDASKIYSSCVSQTEEEKVKYARLIKSLQTQKTKLPKTWSALP